MLVKRYNFDELIIGLMKNFLRFDRYGLNSYLVPSIKNNNIKQYFIDGFEILKDGHCLLIFDLIMESKKAFLLSNYRFLEEEVIELVLIQKGIKWIINQDYESLLDTLNLWNSTCHEYAIRTFYYHVPMEIKKKNAISETDPKVLQPDNF